MAVVDIKVFRGLRPRISNRHIKTENAQLAQNCRITSGAVEAWREKKNIASLVIAGEVKTIYRYPDGKWLQWNEQVDLVRSPVTNNTTDRIYISNLPYLRVMDNSTVDVSTPTSGSITGATKANPCQITDVAHGLYDGMFTDITGVGGMTELNGNRYRVTVVDADKFTLDNVDSSGYGTYTSGGTWTRVNFIYPELSYRAGVPAPIVAPTAALSGSHTTPVNTAYVYTFVNDWGEESAPSPTSNIVAPDFSTGSVDLTTMDTAPASYLGYVPISKWRIYRVLSGTSGADYLFVAEVTINAGSPQYNDAIESAGLGEVLPTDDWDEPPAALQGITAMANGMVAGFVGNTIYFCEPFLPYTYPEKYTLSVSYEIVSLGTYGNSLVVTTEGPPHLITGSSPDAMSMDDLPFPQPCIQKRGTVNVQGGMIYPTSNGLFFVGQGGSKLITKDYYTRREWQDLSPISMLATWYDNRYFAYLETEQYVLEYQPQEDELATINMDGAVSAFYVDREDDDLFFCQNENNVNEVYQFAAEGSRMTFLWKSKAFEMPYNLTITAARIVGAFESALTDDELAALTAARADAIAVNQALITAGTVNGSVNSYAVNVQAVNDGDMIEVPGLPSETTYSFKLIVDGVERYSGFFTDNEPIRLPAGYRGRTIEVELDGKYQLYRLLLGTSIQEVAG